MPLISEDDIERIKRGTDLISLVQSRGIELKKHGTKDFIGRCPFHDDKDTPNLIVTPARGLFHCMSCGKAGNPIQFVQYHDGVSFRHAYELLKNGGKAAFTPAGQTPGLMKISTIPRLSCPLDAEADDATLFGQVVTYYHQKLKETPTARAYLSGRGLDSDELIERHQIGFADRTLGLRLPDKNRLEAKDGFHFLGIESREYRVAGLEKTLGTDALKIVLRLRHGEAMHLDQIDLCRDIERRKFIERAAQETGLTAELLKRDIGKLLLAVEQAQIDCLAAGPPLEKMPVVLTPEEREQALAWLRAPNLIQRLREVFLKSGIIGEETNTLVAYLAGVSRKLMRPLAIIIQSASAAGKTTLMDAVLSFFPEEDRVKYSAMTGQSLYYLGETSLKHKILAVVEEAGAEKASYALKLLQSEGELTIASTGKDPQTGKMVTQEYHVEGPVMIFLTTTAIDLDEELQNRCLTLAVDETPEQTARIHQTQRERRTLAGLIAREERKDLIEQLRNAQRLLQPVEILNPYAPNLTFATGRTRNRRDHEKYLTLIDAIALLHQHQRPRAVHPINGRVVECVEVKLDDIALANQIAPEVLARSLDELPPQTRRLLGHIRELLEKKRAAAAKLGPGSAWFSRKELRDASGWSLTQVSVHLERLVALEYIAFRHGRMGSQFIYEALFDPNAPESVAHIGLIDVEKLRESHVYNAQVSGFSRGVSVESARVTGGDPTGPLPMEILNGSQLDTRYRGNGNAHLEAVALTPAT